MADSGKYLTITLTTVSCQMMVAVQLQLVTERRWNQLGEPWVDLPASEVNIWTCHRKKSFVESRNTKCIEMT